MDDRTIRGYDARDADGVTELINLVEEHAGGQAGWTPEDVRSMVAAMVRDPATDSQLWFAPDGTMVAFGFVTTPPDDGYRIDILGGVHPDRLGRGIGRDLLGWQLNRAGEIHGAKANGRPWQVHGDSFLGDERRTRLYRRFGMTPVRYWFEMLAPTANVEPMPLPDGLRAEVYREEYEERLYHAHMEAFADHWGFQRPALPEWTTFAVRSDGFRPDLSLVAFDGAELVGYVLSYEDADSQRFYIGQVGTRRPWRKRGLAGALLTRALAAADDAGKSTAILGVDADSPTGAVGVYERVGFVVEQRGATYALSLTG